MAPALFDSLVLPHIGRLQAYTPGLQPSEPGWTKLNTNECPYPPSPMVLEALQRDLGEAAASLRLYPNPSSAGLRAVVARLHGLSETQVCIGNGSDDLLNLLVRLFGSSESILGHTFPSYSLYPVLVEIQAGRMETVAFDRSMVLPFERIAKSTAKAFFLTSPNAPTGLAFPNTQIEGLLKQFQGVLIVDEAYAPFAAENAICLLEKYPRLVIVRTLSKAHALAGLRVGYALAHPTLIDLLDRVRDSYNVNRLSQVAAIAALQDTVYYEGVIARILATRDRFLAHLDQRGWFTYRSASNFLFTEPRDARGQRGPATARSLYAHLCANKILVRYFASHALTDSFLRISVGTDVEMDLLQQALDTWQT